MSYYGGVMSISSMEESCHVYTEAFHIWYIEKSFYVSYGMRSHVHVMYGRVMSRIY